jgi:N-formylglutamate deformylase
MFGWAGDVDRRGQPVSTEHSELCRITCKTRHVSGNSAPNPMTNRPAYQFDLSKPGEPLIATAIHNGHDLRDEILSLVALREEERLREEDPFTGDWTAVAGNRIVVQRSRFEVDFNRPRDRSVYARPEDAWGLSVYRSPLPNQQRDQSLALYDGFYERLQQELAAMSERHGQIIVFDLHSYNHRRAGPDQPADDPGHNPEVNVGTGTMDRDRWSRIIERFIDGLRRFDFSGRRLDVRENVRFQGGNMARWVHQTFPRSVCVIAIEVKKFFMDEWSGELDVWQHRLMTEALRSTVPGLLHELCCCG